MSQWIDAQTERQQILPVSRGIWDMPNMAPPVIQTTVPVNLLSPIPLALLALAAFLVLKD